MKTPSRIAVILLITTLVSQYLAVNSAAHGAALTPFWLTLSAIALLGRAVAEGFRPDSEWVRGILWGIGIALFYAVAMPMWKHFSDNLGLASLGWMKVAGAGMLLNLAVPVVKALLILVRRRTA